MSFKMTNEHIDTINKLLETNGEALTAFYDEALSQGMAIGVVSVFLGTVALSGGIQIIKKFKDHKKD